jgi:hypothetical protein
MTLIKTSNVINAELCLAHGTYDSRKDDSFAQYDSITLKEIGKLVETPQAVEKVEADFIIPSEYRGHMARSHSHQREMGEYWLLALDIDEGSPTLTEVKDAVKEVIGNAHALLYSSAGASTDERKWRVLIPLAQCLFGEQYTKAQMALFQLMRDQGIICDPALSRSAQPIYLPNVPPDRRDIDGNPLFYNGVRHVGDGFLDVQTSKIWDIVEFNEQQELIAQKKAELAAADRARERAQKREQFGTDVDPIDVFNERHSVSDMLLKYGYEQQGRSPHYRSPYQTSGSYATKDFGTHWVSLSSSDTNAGIGMAKGGDLTYCFGDAFDLYAHFEHGGDMKKAVREYGAEIRPSQTDIVRDSFADFDTVSDEPAASEPKADEPQAEPTEGGPTVINGQVSQLKLHRTFDVASAQPVLKSSYLVKGWLGRGQMSVVYGPSNVGKSFFCLDMAFSIAADGEWFGSRVRGGTVLYLATEGGNAFRNRVYALRKQRGVTDVPLVVRPSPIDLLRAEVDMPALGELCKEVTETYGEIAMIVVDTLSRAMAGGNENGPEDMTRLIGNLDVLRDLTGAHIMVVHHSGKDTAAGARGHSSLRAATDTEIELEVEGEGLRIARTTKQRDMEPKPPLGFKLDVHELGQDEDGDPVTTCTIKLADEGEMHDLNVKKPRGANQAIVVEAFRQLRAEGAGEPNPGGVGWPEVGTYWIIDERDLRTHARGKLTDKANPDSAYSSAMQSMIGSGYMQRNNGYVWITAREGRAG